MNLCPVGEGVKAYRSILLLFWRPEVQNGSCWAKIKVLAGSCAFRRLRERRVSGPSPFLEDPASHGSWRLAHPLSQHLQSLSEGRPASLSLLRTLEVTLGSPR